MTSIADGSVIIQTSAVSVSSTPSCFGEVVLIAAHFGLIHFPTETGYLWGRSLVLARPRKPTVG
jgi:hypothetical protein